MVKGYNRDERRYVDVNPSQDCIGEVIFARVWKGNEIVSVVNDIAVDPKKKVIIIDYDNSEATTGSSTVVVYGKNMNEDEFKDIVSKEIYEVASGQSQEEIEFESGLYKSFKVSIEGDSKITAGIRIEDVPRVVDPLAITGVAKGNTLSVPCNFFELPSSDEYTLVFEAEGIGVIGRERLLVYDIDGRLRQENDA